MPPVLPGGVVQNMSDSASQSGGSFWWPTQSTSEPVWLKVVAPYGHALGHAVRVVPPYGLNLPTWWLIKSMSGLT